MLQSRYYLTAASRYFPHITCQPNHQHQTNPSHPDRQFGSCVNSLGRLKRRATGSAHPPITRRHHHLINLIILVQTDDQRNTNKTSSVVSNPYLVIDAHLRRF